MSLAPYTSCEGLRMLQVDLPEDRKRQGTRQIEIYADEFIGYGKPLLRSPFQ